ncbi:hypothetical protein D9M68_874370 [compost metagenome]
MKRPLAIKLCLFVGDGRLGLLGLSCAKHYCSFGGGFGWVVVQVGAGLARGGTTAPFGEHFYGDSTASPKPIEQMAEAVGIELAGLVAVPGEEVH